MQQVAERVTEVIRDEFDEACLVGVSYYDSDGVGHVYRSDWAEERYDPEAVDAIVDELRLESIGHGVYEKRQRQTLHATARVYDEMLDIAVPTDGTEGVAVALDTDGEYRVREVVSVVERAVADADVGHRSP